MSELSDDSATLYIGDLHINVTETVLFEKFAKYGTILSSHISRDHATKKSLGHGYIIFKKRNDAHYAMEDSNLSIIYGQPCRVMWYEKDPSKRKFGAGNIVIKNFDESISVKEIHDAFSLFGKITSCRLKTDDSGSFMGCAFVNYQNDKDAKKAIETMNQTLFKKNLIVVEKFYVKENVSQDQSTDCYVDNIPCSFDDSILRIIFEKFGPVTTAKIMVNEDGTSKGFGFVSFKQPEDAVRASADLNGTELQKKCIRVYQLSRRKEYSSCNLYIRNLSEKMTDERLKALFIGFGRIVSAKVMINPGTQRPLGYGFVAFLNQEDGDNAIQEMNGKTVDGKPLFVALKSSGKATEQQTEVVQSDTQRPTNQIMPPYPASFFPPSPVPFVYPTHNFIRLPFPPSTASGKVAPASNDKEEMMRVLEHKIKMKVQRYAGDKTAMVVGQLMKNSVRDCLEMLFDDSVLCERVDSVLATVNGGGDDRSKSEYDSDHDQQLSPVDGSETWCHGRYDGEAWSHSRKMLCRGIYGSVVSYAGDLVGSVMRRLGGLSTTELTYMATHDDYLRAKVEVMVSELREEDRRTDGSGSMATDETETEEVGARSGAQSRCSVRTVDGRSLKDDTLMSEIEEALKSIESNQSMMCASSASDHMTMHS